jgi:hypothetical protein
MPDVLSDADHELGVQLQILQERDATLNREMVEPSQQIWLSNTAKMA